MAKKAADKGTLQMCACGATVWQGPFYRGGVRELDGEYVHEHDVVVYQCMGCNRQSEWTPKTGSTNNLAPIPDHSAYIEAAGAALGADDDDANEE